MRVTELFYMSTLSAALWITNDLPTRYARWTVGSGRSQDKTKQIIFV